MKVYYIEFQKNSITCKFLSISRKYLFDPIPKSNPYEKEEFQHPYTLIESESQDQNIQHQENSISIKLFQPALKTFCDHCKKQITHQTQCKTLSNELCVYCFIELQKFHQEYQIVQKLQYPLFQSSWSTYHEILLLSSIQKWGFGNWKQLREYMEYFGAKFTQDQIQTHYNTFYLSDKTFQPKFSQNLIQRKKDSLICKNSIQNQVSIASLTTQHRDDSNNYTFEQIDDFSHEAMMPQVPMKIVHLQQQNKLMGYNSNRKQFEVDFDQTAEKSLANLQFRDDDLPEQRQIKYKILDQYNKRLNKRYEVSDFIVEHKLLDVEYQKQVQQTQTQYQKQAAQQLKKFMRFSSFSQHNQLIKRMAFQKQVKSIIEGLRSYRRTCNSGKLKQISEILKKKSLQKRQQPNKNRGHPRKIIHVDNSQKSNETESQVKNRKQNKNEEQLLKRLKINMKDLKYIIKSSQNKKNGDSFVYKDVEVIIVDKK